MKEYVPNNQNYSRLLSLIVLAMMTFSVFASHATESIQVNEERRKWYLERAQVWRPVEVPRVNVLAGPQNEISVAPESNVTCQYEEWKTKPTGATPKFNCKLIKSKEAVRVKYGSTTREIFAETAASRLFWLLGFYADEVYPVKLTCLGCPEKNPFKPEDHEPRKKAVFPYAIIERKYSGAVIEEKEDQGWKWAELETVNPEYGGAPRSHLDALKLLAVLVQHGDNKPQQQRLGCPPEAIRDDGCAKPVLMVQDLGSTFGRADWLTSEQAKMDFQLWAEKPIWDPIAEAEHFERTGYRVCIGNLTSSVTARDEGLDKPIISEPGREFLAGLISQLTDQQIRDLFTVARAEKMGETVEENGAIRPVRVEDWVAAFKQKRTEIVERKCPVPEIAKQQ